MSKNQKQPGSWHCEACGKGSRSLSAFDMHRTGSYARRKDTRRCLNTKEMRAKGMRQASNGAWVTGIERDHNEQRAS